MSSIKIKGTTITGVSDSQVSVKCGIILLSLCKTKDAELGMVFLARSLYESQSDISKRYPCCPTQLIESQLITLQCIYTPNFTLHWSEVYLTQ